MSIGMTKMTSTYQIGTETTIVSLSGPMAKKFLQHKNKKNEEKNRGSDLWIKVVTNPILSRTNSRNGNLHLGLQ